MKFLVGIILSAVMFLTWTATVYAADSANKVCIDTDDNGQYDTLKASGMSDRDCDGYTTAQGDCDDTNPLIYPGEWTASGCSAGEFKQCNSGGSGSYGSCTAAASICEATNGGSCYYVDAGSGNNSNNGSYASPWADFTRACSYESAGSRPANWVDLAPGDVVYLKGTTNLTASYNAGASYGTLGCLLDNSQSGTSSHFVTFKQFPGATAEFRETGKLLFRSDNGGGYYKIKNFKGGNTTGNAIYLNGGGSNSVIEGVNFYNANCTTAGDNCSFIELTSGTTGVSILRSRFSDIQNSGYGFTENVSHLLFYEGNSNIVRYNQLMQANAFNYGGPDRAFGVKYKRGQTGGASGDTYWEYNRALNISGQVFLTAQKNTYIRYNTVYDSQGLYGCRNLGTSTNQAWCGYHTVEYNTFIQTNTSDPSVYSSRGIDWNILTDYTNFVTWGPLSFRYNLIVDATSISIYNLAQYINNANFVTVCGGVGPSCSGGIFTMGNNCFYNSQSIALNFNLFSQGESYGANYNFTNWKGTVGLDTTSFNENPSIDSSSRATSSNCSSMGSMLLNEAGPTPTPTATATPTASPTPTATPTATVAPLIGRCRKGQVRTTGPGNKY